MKALILAALLLGVAAPAAADPQPYRGECRKLTNQIARYERDAGWARERGNQLWEQASVDQAERLSERRARLCPEFADPNYAAEFVAMLDVATRAAARFLMGGL